MLAAMTSLRGSLAMAALIALAALAACEASGPPPVDAAGTGLARAPIGGGYCCPIDPVTCNCFRNGGWTDLDDLESCPQICDLAPVETRITPDEHGCDRLTGPRSCLETSP